jgi:plasmid stability protein
VPTIQIRDVPDETYETIRLRARAAGQSIQAYMLDQVNAMAASKTKEEVVAAIEAVLERHGTAVTTESIVRDRDADRR